MEVNLGNISVPVIVPQRGVDYWTASDKQEVVTEAVNAVNAVVEPQEQARQNNELTRISNENNRISAEQTRQLNETTRQSNEETRIANETTRQSNESTRQTNEATRQSNETSRASTFSQQMINVATAIQGIHTSQTAYDENATAKTTAFNNNATQKTTDFNTNATAKTNAYNENAIEKIAEYDEHVSEITEEIDDIKAEQITQNTNIQNLSTNKANKSETYTKTETDNLLFNKVDKVAGKGLSTEDFTTAEKQKLASLENYDDTDVKTDISAIKTEQTTQNTNIEELQTQVETLQEDLESANSEIAELNTDITNMRKAMITVEGQGTDITLENTSENKLVEFGLEGRTEQEQLSGKNLANNKFSDWISSGVYSYIPISLKQGQTYTLSAKRIGAVKTNYYNFGIAKDGTSYPFIDFRAIIDYGSGSPLSNYTFTVDDTWVNPKLCCYINQSEIKFNELFQNYNIQLEEGSTATSYEPYCGGIPAPNSGYECPIKNVTGNANVKIQNKNLFVAQKIVDDSNHSSIYIQDGFIHYATSGNRMIIKPTIIKKNTAYTYKLKLKSGTTSTNQIFFEIRYTDGTTEDTPINTRTNKEEFETIFSTNPAKTVKDIRSQWSNQLEAYLKIDGSMILEGSYTAETMPSYVEHQEQNYPFTLGDKELCQIRTFKDYFFKNVINSKYYNNQLIANKWYLHKELAKYDLGNATWAPVNEQETARTQGLFCSFSKKDIFKYSATDIPAMLSNKYKARRSYELVSVGRNPADNTIATFNSALYIQNSLFSGYTNAQVKTALQGTLLYYPLGTPTNTEITDTTLIEQLDAILEATSYDDITYISSESDELGFNMNVVAVANANKVIDTQNNEIDTIKSRLDLLEG